MIVIRVRALKPQLGERVPDRRAVVGDADPLDRELAERQLEVLDDPGALVRATQDRAEPARLVVVELDHRLRLVVRGAGEHVELARALVVQDDGEPRAARARDQLYLIAYPRQAGLEDLGLHRTSSSGRVLATGTRRSRLAGLLSDGGANHRRGSRRASTGDLRRDQRREDREDQDVERGERRDAAVEPGRDRQRGEDQLELAAADEHQRRVGGGRRPEAVDPCGDDAGDDVERQRDHDRHRDRQGDGAHGARRDRQPEPEEEDRRERVAQRDDQPLDARPDPRAGDDHPRQERADGVRGARRCARSRRRRRRSRPAGWW